MDFSVAFLDLKIFYSSEFSVVGLMKPYHSPKTFNPKPRKLSPHKLQALELSFWGSITDIHSKTPIRTSIDFAHTAKKC